MISLYSEIMILIHHRLNFGCHRWFMCCFCCQVVAEDAVKQEEEMEVAPGDQEDKENKEEPPRSPREKCKVQLDLV